MPLFWGALQRLRDGPSKEADYDVYSNAFKALLREIAEPLPNGEKIFEMPSYVIVI